ncbi:MAG: exo-alpha-sialidase [Verrucomicrobia bacterium]|nr:exo-alpha-sialidase [Verrucomicrobiota bacterium]
MNLLARPTAVCALLAVLATAAGAVEVTAIDARHTTLYHSPEHPGYTCWTGAWLMPDGDVMVAFTQATGPRHGRMQAPPELLRQMSWTAEYDMTGLDLRNVHLRSHDGGRTWTQVSADAFESPMNGISGDCETALPDGTVVRGVWGQYLPYNPELPKTGYLQRSRDGTRTWGPPEVFLDPKRYVTWPKRLRVLRDGRLLLVGGVERVPVDGRARIGDPRHLEPLLAVSSDGGHTWSEPIDLLPPEAKTKPWGGEEYDAAELPNGDLLCVFRRPDPDQTPRREVRWQGVLRKHGATWVPGWVAPAPFPHSGHPELLATREGVVLHLATTGIHWTADAGQSWHALDLPGTAYYPRSVQLADGRILVVGHVGRDDPYGKVDQSIVLDSFRLVVR